MLHGQCPLIYASLLNSIMPSSRSTKSKKSPVKEKESEHTIVSLLQDCGTILAVAVDTILYNIEEEDSDLIEKMSWEALGVLLVEQDIERSMCLSTE